MEDFLILIAQLLFIAALQTLLETVLASGSWKKYLQTINIACIVASYIFLIRYVAYNLLPELMRFVRF